MVHIENLININWYNVFIGFITLVLGWQFLYKTFIEGIIKRFGIETKAMREKREDHELLINTSKSLIALQERHEKDERKLEKCLSEFIEETKNKNEELTYSIKVVMDGQLERDRQIEALMCGSKELLGDTIDQRYSRYIALGGIPENEVDEFDSIYEAYKGLKGNHGRETKYNYVKEHLPVIPVEVILKHNN